MVKIRLLPALVASLLVVCVQAQQVRPSENLDGYRLGPIDLILIRILDFPELGASPYRIDTNGNINIPLVGKMHAGRTYGRTTRIRHRRAH